VTTPAPASYQLTNEVYQSTLNGSGNGKIQFTPGQPPNPGSGVGASRKGGLSWNLTSITVGVNPAPGNTQVKLSCTVNVYLSWGILPTNVGYNDLVGTTTLLPTNIGPSVANCLIPVTIRPGDWIIVVLSNGDPNAVCNARAYGQVSPPGTS
jgi:hypothetical protein